MSFFSKLFNPVATDDQEEKKEKTAEKKAKNTKKAVTEKKATEKKATEKKVAEKKATEESRSAYASNIGILQESLRELILDAVAPFTGNDDFVGLKIWANDQAYHVIDKDSFKKGLKASFDSMHLYTLGKGDITVIYGEPAEDDKASPLAKKGVIPAGKFWLQLIEPGKTEAKHAKAVVSVFQGIGSCKKKSYLLNAGEKTNYHIGRGAFNRKNGMSFRVNDIIINDSDPNPDIQKLNNFVSSSQADIILADGYFYLKAMPSGCRANGGSPTKILRNQESIELRDCVSSHILKDGDIIELGKSVLLLFKITE